MRYQRATAGRVSMAALELFDDLPIYVLEAFALPRFPSLSGAFS